MSGLEKFNISHRGRALRAMFEYLSADGEANS